MSRGRRYTEEEKEDAVLTLRANGDKIRETAKLIGVPAPDLSNWSNGKFIKDSTRRKIIAKEDTISSKCKLLVHRFLDSIEDDDIFKETASGRIKSIEVLLKQILLLEQSSLPKTDETPLETKEISDSIRILADKVRVRKESA